MFVCLSLLRFPLILPVTLRCSSSSFRITCPKNSNCLFLIALRRHRFVPAQHFLICHSLSPRYSHHSPKKPHLCCFNSLLHTLRRCPALTTIREDGKHIAIQHSDLNRHRDLVVLHYASKFLKCIFCRSDTPSNL